MFKKDATLRQPHALRELTNSELRAVTGGDGSTTSGSGDGSTEGSAPTPAPAPVKLGQRMHKPYDPSTGG